MFGKSNDVILDFAGLCGFLNRKSFAITTFGRHVENRLEVDKHGSGFLFSLTVLKRKVPIELGAM